MEAFERLAEQPILEAMARGEFDNLPGAGRPLILDDHPFVPDELWMAYKIVRNAGCLPPEVEERKEISRLVELLAGLQDEAERMRAQKRLVVLRMKVDMGRPRPLPFTSAGDTRNVLSNAWPGRGEGDPMRNSGSLSWQELRQIDDPRDLDWSSVPKTLIERHANPWQDIDEAAGCITRELEAQVGIKPSDKR